MKHFTDTNFAGMWFFTVISILINGAIWNDIIDETFPSQRDICSNFVAFPNLVAFQYFQMITILAEDVMRSLFVFVAFVTCELSTEC